MDSNIQNNTKLIKDKAKELGFISCGISKADFLEEEAPRLEKWLNQNLNGKMAYMERNFDKRLDPRLLVPDSKSVISLLFNYYTNKKQEDKQSPKICDVGGRVFVDSAPIMEKAWASKSGLGWIGKNTNLISKKTGSFFFIAEVIVDLEL